MKNTLGQIMVFIAVAMAIAVSVIIVITITDTIDKNNERKLEQCIEKTDGSDVECERCFYEVYGVKPNDLY